MIGQVEEKRDYYKQFGPTIPEEKLDKEEEKKDYYKQFGPSLTTTTTTTTPVSEPSIGQQILTGVKRTVQAPLGLLEAGAQLGTGMGLGFPASMVRRIIAPILNEDYVKAEEEAGKLAHKLTYMPQTEAGQIYGKLLNKPLQFAGKLLQQASEKYAPGDPESQSVFRTLSILGTMAIAPIASKGVKSFIRKNILKKEPISMGDVKVFEQQTKVIKPKPITENILTPENIQEIANIIKTLKPLGREQKAMRGKEFGKRIQAAKVAGEAIGGEAGIYAKLSKMKGEYEKVNISTQFEDLRSKLPQETIDAMANTINKNSFLLEGEKLSAGKGLLNLLEGKLPQPKQLSLLDTVYGGDLVGALLKKRPILERMATLGLEIANLPRSFMAGFLDLSFGLRQGAFAAPRYFKQFTSSFVKQFKWFGEEKAYQATMEVITQDPYFKLAREARVAFTELGKIMAKREERFTSPLAEKIPILGKGIRMTSRAYTAFANKFRMDIFKRLARDFERMGYKLEGNPELLQAMGSYTNVLTARGGLGKLEPAALALNAFFFSPRLQSSRLGLLFGKYQPLNPAHYIMLPKPIRMEALKTWISFVSAGMTIVTAAKLAGVEVGANPLSADFGKMKVRNTRIDIWSGLQPLVRTTAQLFAGKTVSTTTGKVTKTGEGYKPLSRLDILSKWIEYKEAPAFSFATSLLRGRTVFGEQFKLPKEVFQRFTPMVMQDMYDIAKDDPDLLPLSALGIFGVGIQTYKAKEKGAIY